MYHYFKNKMSAAFGANAEEPPEEAETAKKLSDNLLDNMVTLREKCRNTSDFMAREVTFSSIPMSMMAMEGLISLATLSKMILPPLSEAANRGVKTPQEMYDYIRTQTVIGMDVNDVYTTDEIFTFLMSGFAVILIDGMDKGVAIGVQGFSFRSVSEPSNEVNVRGSREGFTEPIRINLSMVRRRIKSPKLKFELFQLGSESRTDVCMVYMTDIVDPKLLRDIRRKLKQIKLDVVLESGYIQPFLEGKPLSLFSDVGTTERPDTLCAKINEGRIAVLVDGTPFALIVPYLFSENFQSLDDYCHRPYYTTFIRILKYVSFFFTILLPGVYVGVGTFHPELFPHALLYNIASAEETTPLPLVLEALLIHFIYEVMREAGLRLPRPIGHAVSIVGALVIGDAAVTAGLIGAPMVMVVALTAISSFVVPSIYEPVAILRFAFIILGGTTGLYGITLGLTLVLFNMTRLNNFGVPYTAPISPFSLRAQRDVFYRAGWKKLGKRSAKIQHLSGVDIHENLDQ